MSDWLDDFRPRRDGVTIPTIWVAFALSVLIHVLVLSKWLPQIHLPSLDEIVKAESQRSLVVNLAPPSSPATATAPSPAAQARPSTALQAPRPKAQPRARPAPPVLALNRAAPDVPRPPPEITPAPARPAPAGDLSSYIEARRRARGDPTPPAASSPSAAAGPSAPPAEDENARSNRAVAANLGLNRKPTFGPDPAPGGGVFQLKHVGYEYAEFYFYGWNREIRRNTTQLIEVRKENNSDIRIAVVRRMIAIIREYEQQDFLWESQRLGRNLMLSARQRDNAGLEDFMMHEFFSNTGPIP